METAGDLSVQSVRKSGYHHQKGDNVVIRSLLSREILPHDDGNENDSKISQKIGDGKKLFCKGYLLCFLIHKSVLHLRTFSEEGHGAVPEKSG